MTGIYELLQEKIGNSSLLKGHVQRAREGKNSTFALAPCALVLLFTQARFVEPASIITHAVQNRSSETYMVSGRDSSAALDQRVRSRCSYNIDNRCSSRASC